MQQGPTVRSHSGSICSIPSSAGRIEAWRRATVRRNACRYRPLILSVAFVCLVLGGLPDRAAAQATFPDEVGVAVANALIGGFTSGVAAWIREGSFTDAFVGGLMGGGLQYVGKRVSTASVPGAGLAGRLIGSTGASVVRNSAGGTGRLDRVIVAFGPVVFDWRTVSDSMSLGARLHLGRAIFLGRLIADDELELDWAETLSAGAPVFRAPGRVIGSPDGGTAGGLELWGIMVLSDPSIMPPIDYGRLLSHERIHLVQDDFLNVAWADPIEDRIFEALPYGGTISRYIDVGGMYMVLAGLLNASLPYEDRPWEDEAAYMEAGW